MTRYEAYILKDWQESGQAYLVAARFRDNGRVELGALLLDTWCLGVKDAVFQDDYTEGEFRDALKKHLPDADRQPVHPAYAKKLAAGAAAYAQQFGFAPHRDYKKVLRVFNGVDAAACTETFVFGKDGKPMFISGEHDTPDRIKRILTMLEAHCGKDGYHYLCRAEEEDFDDLDTDIDEDGEDDWLECRDELMDWFDDHADEVVDFYEFSGVLTALQLSPQPLSPLAALDTLWLEPKARVKSEKELQELLTLLMAYWNVISNLIAVALAPDATDDDAPIDIFPEDLGEVTTDTLAAAFLPWSVGFYETANAWSKQQGNLLETRVDLAPHWRVVCLWNEMAQKTVSNETPSPELEAMGKANGAKLHNAVFALTRALRGTAQGL